jgi:hypothetical protein
LSARHPDLEEGIATVSDDFRHCPGVADLMVAGGMGRRALAVYRLLI